MSKFHFATVREDTPDTSWDLSVRRSLSGASGINIRSLLSWRRTDNLLKGVCTYIILYSAFKIQKRVREEVPSLTRRWNSIFVPRFDKNNILCTFAQNAGVVFLKMDNIFVHLAYTSVGNKAKMRRRLLET